MTAREGPRLASAVHPPGRHVTLGQNDGDVPHGGVSVFLARRQEIVAPPHVRRRPQTVGLAPGFELPAQRIPARVHGKAVGVADSLGGSEHEQLIVVASVPLEVDVGVARVPAQLRHVDPTGDGDRGLPDLVLLQLEDPPGPLVFVSLSDLHHTVAGRDPDADGAVGEEVVVELPKTHRSLALSVGTPQGIGEIGILPGFLSASVDADRGADRASGRPVDDPELERSGVGTGIRQRRRKGMILADLGMAPGLHGVDEGQKQHPGKGENQPPASPAGPVHLDVPPSDGAAGLAVDRFLSAAAIRATEGSARPWESPVSR